MGFFTANAGKRLQNLSGEYLNKSPFYHPDFFSLIWLTVAIISGIRK
jgi:hypothetical protein